MENVVQRFYSNGKNFDNRSYTQFGAFAHHNNRYIQHNNSNTLNNRKQRNKSNVNHPNLNALTLTLIPMHSKRKR